MSFNPAMYVPGAAMISTVADVLEEIAVSEEDIKKVVEILESYSDSIRYARPGQVSAGAYGGAATGQSLGHHTGLAHQKVVEAMTRMVETLAGTSERVIAYHKEINFHDDESRDTYDRLRARGESQLPLAPRGSAPAPPPLVPTDPVPDPSAPSDTVEA